MSKKCVLISIKPQWCAKIAYGEKTIEVRKSRPKLETPFRCYIYCTRGSKHLCLMQNRDGVNLIACCDWTTALPVGGEISNGKVIGEFTCDYIQPMKDPADGLVDVIDANCSCLTPREVIKYADGKMLYGWHISDLQIYDKPMELGEFFFPPELYCEKELCGRCPKDQVADENGEYEFDCEWKKPITRAPQSWCYVEATHAPCS